MLLFLAAALVGCSRGKPKPVESLQSLEAPSAAGAGQAKFCQPRNEALYMTWVEQTPDSTRALRYARLVDDRWAKAVTVSEGKGWFAYFADLPSMVMLSGGAIVAEWTEMVPRRATARDIRVTVSRDGGNTWSRPVNPHKWHQPAENGMVCMLPFSPERAFIAWVDGRDLPRKASLRMATVTESGRAFNNAQLDGLVCDGCPIDGVTVPGGFIVAYRDRTPQGYRDIALVRLIDNVRREPQTVYPDNWRTMECPASGPAIDALGSNVVVAWYTEADGVGVIKASFSEDSGEHFGRAIVVAGDRPRGRVDVTFLADGSAAVCWVAGVSITDEELRVRRVWPEAEMSKGFETVTPRIQGLSSCLPQMARVGGKLYFAWTNPANPAVIELAVGEIPE